MEIVNSYINQQFEVVIITETENSKNIQHFPIVTLKDGQWVKFNPNSLSSQYDPIKNTLKEQLNQVTDQMIDNFIQDYQLQKAEEFYQRYKS